MSNITKLELSIAEQRRSKRKEAILKASKLSKDLTDTERHLISLSTYRSDENGNIITETLPIQELSTDHAVGFVSKSLLLIFKLVGYKHSQDEIAFISSILTKTVTSKYKKFSWKEILNAFQLCAMGDLDQFLPIDSKGNPDKNHYGQFSLMYINKILSAYDKMRMTTNAKVRLEEPKKNISKDLELKIFESIKKTEINTYSINKNLFSCQCLEFMKYSNQEI